jgi:hypothetical protein
MADSDLQAISFGGDIRRQRMSLAREYAARLVTIPSGASLSEEIDIRRASGVAVSVDNAMDGTHLAIYASAQMGGIKRPVRDNSNNILIITATDGAIVILPSDIFPLGYISLVSCSDINGTLQTEGADRVLIVMLKP